MKQLCKDLADEYQALDYVVAPLSPVQWEIITPFDNWTIKDHISHLAYFDRAAFLSATDQQAFTKNIEDLLKYSKNFGDIHQHINAVGGCMTGSELLAWWRKERIQLVEVFELLEPNIRLPWTGPTMSARSSATARIMETWAHGQDIVDALKITRPATDRIKHIAHIGVATFGWSFENRHLQVPIDKVRVELISPSNDIWTWGPQDSYNCVKGDAQEFCLVVTQRRNVKDTNLLVTGPIANQWMSIAQAFAGPAEDAPEPGQRIVSG